ncbi:MAG: orotidine-5'-phosphate decarboxylase [Gemmatimonadota bacterium]
MKDPGAIPTQERLIVALDVESPARARQLVEQLGDAIQFYKLGLQLFLAGGYFELADWLAGLGKKVFVDLKLFDVPNTVESAVRQLHGRQLSFLTVHGNDAILEAACRGRDESLKILAVTALTSLDQRDMEDLGFHTDLDRLVVSRARRAAHIGCDGVIASGREVPALREALGRAILIVVPGIRPRAAPDSDDQKRTVDVEEAFRRGADYIVVGRPIRQAADPRAVATDMQARIARALASRS